MKTIFLQLAALVFISGSLLAQQNTAEDKVRKMLELNGSKANFEVAIKNMIELQKQQFDSDHSKEFFEKFQDEILAEGYNSLLEKLIPVYTENFTEPELDGIIAFLESEVGIAMTKKTPYILQASMQIGAEWGEELARSIMEKMEQSKE